MKNNSPDICATLSAALGDAIVHLIENRVTDQFHHRTARNETAAIFMALTGHADREGRVDIAKIMHQYASRAKGGAAI